MNSQYQLLIQSIAGIGVTVTAAGVLWCASTLNVTQERLARIEEQVRILGADRYSSSDANKDNQIVRSQLANLEFRLTKLESKP
jgi:hypothetical protein